MRSIGQMTYTLLHEVVKCFISLRLNKKRRQARDGNEYYIMQLRVALVSGEP